MKTVRSIMQSDVITVAPDASVREFARLLRDRGISGAPVVDASGRLLGVASATDVVAAVAEEMGVSRRIGGWASPSRPSGLSDLDEEPWDDAGTDPLPPEVGLYVLESWEDDAFTGAPAELTVADIMTPVPFTVRPDTTLRELADFMARGHIHRVVVEEEGRMVGVATALDVLRAVASGEPGDDTP